MTPVPLTDAADDTVLIVLPSADQAAPLRHALEEAGYRVRVVTGADEAVDSAARWRPGVVLLDEGLPDGQSLETARRLKADPQTGATPIVFMSGSAEGERAAAAIDVGVVDCVRKPVRTSELVARIDRHRRAARAPSQARSALDAFGQATLVARARDGRRLWQTALARELLQDLYPRTPESIVPPPVMAWVAREGLRRRAGAPPQGLTVGAGERRLTLAMHAMEPDGAADGQWLLVMRRDAEAAQLQALARAFALTGAEAEVLYGVVRGRTDADIGEMLSLSSASVHQHMVQLFGKLGVQTRAEAAAQALSRIDAAPR